MAVTRATRCDRPSMFQSMVWPCSTGTPTFEATHLLKPLTRVPAPTPLASPHHELTSNESHTVMEREARIPAHTIKGLAISMSPSKASARPGSRRNRRAQPEHPLYQRSAGVFQPTCAQGAGPMAKWNPARPAHTQRRDTSLVTARNQRGDPHEVALYTKDRVFRPMFSTRPGRGP